VFLHSGDAVELRAFPYIKQKVEEWEYRKQKEAESRERAIEELCVEDLEREYATLDEILNTINVADLKVAVTGALPLSRAEIKSLLESKGAIVTGSVSSQTSFLFMGNTGKYEITSKMQRAHDLGVKIITL
jgi:DNA ligase (NAD+)